MQTRTTRPLARVAALVGAYLLVGVGLAMTAAVALVTVRDPGTAVTVETIVATAPFLLAPPLAVVLSAMAARGATGATGVALAGGVGSLIGTYLLAAAAVGALVGVAAAAGTTPAVVPESFVRPVLVAGLPTAAVGAVSGYLGALLGRSRDREPGVDVSSSAEPTRSEPTASEPIRGTGSVTDLFEDTDGATDGDE